jgi:hypothetical protein
MILFFFMVKIDSEKSIMPIMGKFIHTGRDSISLSKRIGKFYNPEKEANLSGDVDSIAEFRSKKLSFEHLGSDKKVETRNLEGKEGGGMDSEGVIEKKAGFSGLSAYLSLRAEDSLALVYNKPRLDRRKINADAQETEDSCYIRRAVQATR